MGRVGLASRISRISRIGLIGRIPIERYSFAGKAENLEKLLSFFWAMCFTRSHEFR